MSRNRFAGVCYRCGHVCQAGDGHYERATNVQVKKWSQPMPDRWLIQHAACAVKYRGTNVHHRFAPAALSTDKTGSKNADETRG